MKINLLILTLSSLLLASCAGEVPQNTPDMRNDPIVPQNTSDNSQTTEAAKLISPVAY